MGCSISGCIIFAGERGGPQLAEIEGKVRRIISRGEERGRDSYGIVALRSDGSAGVIKQVGPPSRSLAAQPPFIDEKTTIVLNNDRAEPTTEYIREKRPEDIQPFGERVWVSHNGVIANDRELADRYGIVKGSEADSAVIPPLLERRWNGELDGLQAILRDELVGSYALAIASRDDPRTLYLACNYKPICIEYDRRLDTLFFTSLESYLDHGEAIWDACPTRRLEPYSLFKVTTGKAMEVRLLWKYRPAEERRALVVCSGGLDSTTAAKVMLDRGYEVTLLHFKYRHKAEGKEVEAVERISKALGSPVMHIDTDLFRDVIGNSPLLDPKPIEKTRGGEAGAEFAHEWVPARNLIFLSIATGIAEARGFGVVVVGTNLEEAGAYPDNEMIFINRLNDVLPYATNYQRRVRIEMPVGNLMKHEIVKLGMEIGGPLDLTWSCYEGGERHCGRCGPCYMRRVAFEMNGLRDPVQYAESPQQGAV